MAVVNVSFDTKSKSLSVSIDGMELKDVEMITFNKDWEDKDKSRMFLEIEHEEMDGIEMETYLKASANDCDICSSNDKTVVRSKDSDENNMHQLQAAVKKYLK